MELIYSTPSDSYRESMGGCTTPPSQLKVLFNKWAINEDLTCLLGLPRWLSSKEPACQCRRQGFDPWQEDPLDKEMAT